MTPDRYLGRCRSSPSLPESSLVSCENARAPGHTHFTLGPFSGCFCVLFTPPDCDSDMPSRQSNEDLQILARRGTRNLVTVRLSVPVSWSRRRPEKETYVARAQIRGSEALIIPPENQGDPWSPLISPNLGPGSPPVEQKRSLCQGLNSRSCGSSWFVMVQGDSWQLRASQSSGAPWPFWRWHHRYGAWFSPKKNR